MPRTAVLTCSCFGLSLHPRRRPRNPHASQPIDWGQRRLSQFHRAGLQFLRDLQGCGDLHSRRDRRSRKNPTQRTRTSRPGPRPQSVKEARPGKRDRRGLKNCLFALTGPLIARNHGGNRNQQKNKRTAQRTVSSLPQKHMICSASHPLSRSASSSDIYLTGGRFVDNQFRRFVRLSRCWVRSPPPLPTNPLAQNDLAISRGGKRRQ
jgi:hypothetical protein